VTAANPYKPNPFRETGFDVAIGRVLDEVEDVMGARHAKYGPGNINAHGLLGVRVRLADKIARIENSEADFTDESYRDAWLDVVGYGLIALMLLDGTWPQSDIRTNQKEKK